MALRSLPLTGSLVIAAALGCQSGDVVVSQVAGPEEIATLSTRNSGAMSRGSTLVSLRGKSVPDSDVHGQVVLDLSGAHPVQMKWLGPHNLYLSCDACTSQDVQAEMVKSGQDIITYDQHLRISQ